MLSSDIFQQQQQDECITMDFTHLLLLYIIVHFPVHAYPSQYEWIKPL